MNVSTDYSTAPLVDAKPEIRYPAIQSFWSDVHRLLNGRHKPEFILSEILKLSGLALAADRVYARSVSANETCSSSVSEWKRDPDSNADPSRQEVDHAELTAWFKRIKNNGTVIIEDVERPAVDLRVPADRYRKSGVKSAYVFGFYDENQLVGYLGVAYVARRQTLDGLAQELLTQLASTLNLFILRHETLELWSQTASTLPSALFIKDADNDLRYSYVNPPYRKIVGENIVGKTDLEAFGEERGGTYRRQDVESLASGLPFTEDGPVPIVGDAPEGYFSLIKFPVSTRMGHRYIAGFLTDISSEHKLRLEAEELLEKSKSAEKTKSLFLAAMSHEIRTPLNAIIGLVDELRHTDIPEETRAEYLSSVSSASRALLALINDVLDVSKIEAGQMHMTPVETDLIFLLGECESIFSESCRGKGIGYFCDVTPDLPILIVDTSRLRQILFNLIGNAIKFTTIGGIYVYAKFVRGENKTGMLTLEISDTGTGIAPEDQEKVFGLFEQASRMRGTAAANKGSGLGLCLCKRLVECMNGEIKLKSYPGVGSTFTVILHDLPYLEHSQASNVVRHRKDQTIKINPLALQTRVLIVDDVPMNLKVLGIILKRMSIEFVPASSAADALDFLREADNGITHVLTDIWMPEMNGEELARHIRANPRWSRIRIAAQTADVEASDTFDVKLFDAILSKPITPEKVLTFVRG